jgi:hypothetical protein
MPVGRLVVAGGAVAGHDQNIDPLTLCPPRSSRTVTLPTLLP